MIHSPIWFSIHVLYDTYELGSEKYKDVEDKLVPLISKLFEDRFERLDSEFDK